MEWTQRLRIRQLQVLAVLHETGNLSQTATRLSMTQPALSKWLAQLEEDLGFPLFERHSRGLVPTRYCDALAVHARAILGEAARTEETLRRMADGAAGHLAIGATPAVATDLLPRAIARFRLRYPRAYLSVMESTLERQLPSLREGRLDFLIGRIEEHPLEGPFRCDVLYAESLRIVARPDHPLARKRKVTWAETGAFDWIAPPAGTPLRRELEYELVLASAPTPRYQVESAAILMMAALLQKEDLLAVMSARVAAHFQASGVLVPLALPYKRQGSIGVLRHRDAEETPLRAAFMDALVAERDPA